MSNPFSSQATTDPIDRFVGGSELFPGKIFRSRRVVRVSGLTLLLCPCFLIFPQRGIPVLFHLGSHLFFLFLFPPPQCSIFFTLSLNRLGILVYPPHPYGFVDWPLVDPGLFAPSNDVSPLFSFARVLGLVLIAYVSPPICGPILLHFFHISSIF